MKKTLKISLMLLLMVAFAYAQPQNKNVVVKCLQSGKLDSAVVLVDAMVQHPQTQSDAESWYLRGFVYKEVYKARETSNRKSPARTEAFNSFAKALQLDTSAENQQQNKQNIKFLASKYYNDAASSLDSVNYLSSVENFEMYKKCMLRIDTNFNSKSEDVKFYVALGSLYSKMLEADRKKNADFLQAAKDCYNKVLAMDPNNISANYNMGALYYNQAVSLISSADFDIDIVALSDIQDNSISLFKESLPFMEKAYQLDPKRKETIIGLSGIYFSLNEFEKSNEFKKIADELEQQK